MEETTYPDPFPPWVRQLLRGHLIKDVVDLIARYAQYQLPRRTFPLIHWGPVTRLDLRRITKLLHGEPFVLRERKVEESQEELFLFFLRLSVRETFMTHRQMSSYYYLTNFPVWIDDLAILYRIKIGYALYQQLNDTVGRDATDLFFENLVNQESLRDHLEKAIKTTNWVGIGNYYSRWPDRLIFAVRGRNTEEQFFNQITEQYRQLTVCPTPLNQLKSQLRQVISYEKC